eukprot:185083-Prymnesium_polylepis.1
MLLSSQSFRAACLAFERLERFQRRLEDVVCTFPLCVSPAEIRHALLKGQEGGVKDELLG